MLSFFIRRDLRRAALLGWIMPFCAALSKVAIARFTAALADSGSLLEISCSAFFT